MITEKQIYSYEEAFKKCIEYFGGEDLPAKVFLDKYALRDGDGNILEDTPDKMHHRLAKEFARIEENKFKNPLSEDEIYNFLKDFKYIIPGGSGLSGIGNKYKYVSLSNCFVGKSPLDSYSSICKTDEEIASISKRRGGCGFDISNLRPVGSPTSNASNTSTGIIPFCERYSNTIKEVGQSGRRGALIITLSVHHPEVLNFIKMKQDLNKVNGANVSVKLTDEFLNAVKDNKKYEQRWPVDSETPKISNMVDAKEIWNEIIRSSWNTAEPGILMWDTIIRESPADCYPQFQSSSTNPCITGDVKILTNKGDISILDIIKNGIDNYKVKTYNTVTEEVEYENIIFGAKTIDNTDIIEIEIDDGEKITLTPDHKVFTKNRGYIEAAHLTEKDIIIKIE